MAEQRTPEQEFEAYLSGQSELSKIYQQTDSEGPGELTDKRILAAAHQAVETSHHGTSTRGRRWFVPVAIAASIAIVSVLLVLQYQDIDDDPLNIAKQQNDREIASNLRPDPTKLLVEIVELVKAGELKSAKDQFLAFQQLYPGYTIDYKKYPELEQFKETKR